MPWARRFGAPGLNFAGRLIRGVTTRVANWPSGLSVGPVSTRAANPYVSGASSHGWSRTTALVAIVTTPPATTRAEVSLTGSGKPSTPMLRTLSARWSIDGAADPNRDPGHVVLGRGRPYGRNQLLAQLGKRQTGEIRRGVGEAPQADLQMLTATLDQAVGEEHHRRPGRQVHLVVGTRRCRTQAEKQVGWSLQEADGPVGLDQQ